MNNNEIKQLNMALKGEHMAIESFDHFIKDAQDENVKLKLQMAQRQHKMQAVEISERIQKLGGNPVNTSGVVGAMAEMKFRVDPRKYTNEEIVKNAIEGEKLGADAFRNILSNLNDNSNKQLIENMLFANNGIIEDLNKGM
ncbi:hypothetical protein GCM10008905_11520 [Clostridium malenominatum]|uniref:DUF2383 domain-containing protein n=1 Tax=Clostridium malenominatum TaxID=1539 RepID=A0ABP3U3C3_9CLOT